MNPPTIAVLGDHFFDRYLIGETTRLSPEAPIPVVNIQDEFIFPGGAGNVEANLEALGVRVVSIHGDIRTVKNRLVVDTHHIARWDENDTNEELDVRKIRALRGVDGVIISDYGKGAITYEVIESIAALNLPTFIDSKRDPRDFDIIGSPTFFPNQKEYDTHLTSFALQPQVVVKRGVDGMEFQEFGRVVEKIPSYATRVVSVCGAGDTVIAAYAYATLKPITNPLRFANSAAAVVVEKPYTATASEEEVKEVWYEADYKEMV